MANGPIRQLGVALSVVAAFGLAGCSNSASQLLTTGSIFGGEKTAQATAEKPVTAIDRAIQVAAVSARAQKCGYVFDPAALRAAYLASETQPAPVPTLVSGATETPAPTPVQTPAAPTVDPTALAARYDYTVRTIAGKIADQDDYCDESRTALIKADLNRHLAGDFTPRKMRAASSGLSLVSDSPTKTELNPNWGYEADATPTRRAAD
jgi:hypothetical protein